MLGLGISVLAFFMCMEAGEEIECFLIYIAGLRNC